MLYELTRGLAYLRIEHPALQQVSIRTPVICAVILTVAYVAIPLKPALLGEGSISQGLLSLVATLPGFYFAGLAAVATFDRPGMDVDIPHPAPRLPIKVDGHWVLTDLTKRMFLTYLFSYLTTLSLATCVALLSLHFLGPSLSQLAALIMPVEYGNVLIALGKTMIVAMIILPVASLAVTTLQGIYFLTERLHQTR